MIQNLDQSGDFNKMAAVWWIGNQMHWIFFIWFFTFISILIELAILLWGTGNPVWWVSFTNLTYFVYFLDSNRNISSYIITTFKVTLLTEKSFRRFHLHFFLANLQNRGRRKQTSIIITRIFPVPIILAFTFRVRYE